MFKKFLVFMVSVFLLTSASLAFAKADKQVVVYYFYGKPRCVTCQKIEKYTGEAVKEMKSQKVSYQPVDYDKPENKHYLKDYGLYTKSVIVSERKNGKEIKHKNLNKIWTLTNNEKKFKEYIKKEVKASLGE